MPDVADAKRVPRTRRPFRLGPRKAITAAARRIGTNLSHRHWQRVIDNNPLIREALERQGTFTVWDTPRFRSRNFNMKAFCQDLSAVVMRAIKTDQFVDRDLVQSLMLLAVRAPYEFAKFLVLTVPKQSYLAARPHAEVIEPRETVNPGEYRRPSIPPWVLGYDGPARPGADAGGRLPRGLWLTRQSGARLGLEVRQQRGAFSRDSIAALNADSGIDAALRPEA